MTAGILDTEPALQAVAQDWAALWCASPGASPFQHPAWMLPWWSAFGSDVPRVATWCPSGRLRGILPAYVLHENESWKLLPMGIGTTDILDVVGEGAAQMMGALLSRCAADRVGRFDMMEVPPGSALLETSVPGWESRWSLGSSCPVLALDAIPAGIRRKLRMNRNRAERAGGWTVEDDGPGGFEHLVALHQARWTAVDQPGVLDDPAVLRCLRVALPALHAAGLLRLQVLRVGGVVAAAIMALLAPGRIFFYLSGYDAAQAFVSPGTLLLGAMLEQAVAERRTEAHFLRGQESYKYAWGAVDRVSWNGSFERS